MPLDDVGAPGARPGHGPSGAAVGPSADEIRLVATHLSRLAGARGADAGALLSTLGLDGGAQGPASRVPLDVWDLVAAKLSGQASRPHSISSIFLGPPRVWPGSYEGPVGVVLSRLSSAGRRQAVDHAAGALGLSPIAAKDSWPERLHLLRAEARAFDPPYLDVATSFGEVAALDAPGQAPGRLWQMTEDAALARLLTHPSADGLNLHTLPKTPAVALALFETQPAFGAAMASHFDLADPAHRPLTLRIAALQPEVLFHPSGIVDGTTAEGVAALAADAEVARIVLASAPLLLGRLAAPLRARRDLVAPALALSGLALRDADAGLHDDPALVLAAVSQAGGALAFASPRLQAHRPTVLAAVAQDGRALGFAAGDLRRDPEVVLSAVAQNGYAMEFAAPALQADPAFVAQAVASDPRALRFARGAPRRDRTLALTALAGGAGLQDLSAHFMSDHQVVARAVGRRGRDLAWASPALRDDPLIVLRALYQDPASLEMASDRLRADPAFVAEAIDRDARAFFGAAHALTLDRGMVKMFVAACRRQVPEACRDFSVKFGGRVGARLEVSLPGQRPVTVDMDALAVSHFFRPRR